MRRFPTTPLIIILVLIATIVGWRLFAHNEHERYVAVNRVRQSRSEVRIEYSVEHLNGRIAKEVWDLQNINGRSVASYAVTDRRGNVARFDEPVVNYDVTFAFEKLVQDGIWELQSRPLRGKGGAIYRVHIAQVADVASGQHTFVFTDPHYLATSAGREYHIHLDRNKPVPDLLHLDSTSTDDNRYQKMVDDFNGFGSPRFKRTIADAREKVLKS